MQTLLEYKSWADRIFYDALARFSDAQLQQDRPMLFGNMLSLLNHIYAMDVVWQSHLSGGSHQYQTRNPEDVLAFSALEKHQHQINQWFENYVTSMPSENLNNNIQFIFIGGGDGQMRVIDILHHIVNHSSYHRGHIEGVFYQMGVEPPTTDISVFLQTHTTSNCV